MSPAQKQKAGAEKPGIDKKAGAKKLEAGEKAGLSRLDLAELFSPFEDAAAALLPMLEHPDRSTAYRALQALRWIDVDAEPPLHARSSHTRAEMVGLAIGQAFVQAVEANTVKDRLRCARIVQQVLREIR